MTEDNKTMIVGIMGLSALIQLALAIVAIMYGVDNMKELCSDSFIHLSTWLIVQGAVMLFVVVGAFPLKCLCGKLGLAFYYTIAGLYTLFEIAWLIVGGIILWRDSTPCKELDQPFYIASMVVVIASMVLLVCGGMRTIHEGRSEERV